MNLLDNESAEASPQSCPNELPVLKARLFKARATLVEASPFLGSLVLKVPLLITEDPRVDTACVDGRGICTFGKTFLEALDLPSLRAILLHEALHLALDAFLRRGPRKALRWNLAHDFAINQLIHESDFDRNFLHLPEAFAPMLDPKFKGLSAEEKRTSTRHLLSLWMPILGPVNETSPSPIRFLSPRALSQEHLRLAVDLLIERAGSPWVNEPALAFDVTDQPIRMTSSPELEWMTCAGLPVPISSSAQAGSTRWTAGMPPSCSRSPLHAQRYLHLGAWLRGGFQIPIHAPNRMLPGRCPLHLFLDGTFEAHLVDTYHLALMLPSRS